MVSILGAGGAIGSDLVKELIARNESIRLVSRNPKLVPGAAEAVAADLSNLDNTVKGDCWFQDCVSACRSEV